VNKKEILDFLKENDLNDVEELKSKGKLYVFKFFYEFDEDELGGARGYANDESEDEEDGDDWKEGYYLPYLNDIAADNVGEIIEEAMEEFDVNAQYVSYDVDKEKEDKCEFIAVFSNEDFDIEEVLEDLEL
jgi:hypothetical protein